MIWAGLVLVLVVAWLLWRLWHRPQAVEPRFVVLRQGKRVYQGESGSQARQAYELSATAELWDRGVCRGSK